MLLENHFAPVAGRRELLKVGDLQKRRTEGAPMFRRLTAFAIPRCSGEKEKENTDGIGQTQSQSHTGAAPARSSPAQL